MKKMIICKTYLATSYKDQMSYRTILYILLNRKSSSHSLLVFSLLVILFYTFSLVLKLNNVVAVLEHCVRSNDMVACERMCESLRVLLHHKKRSWETFLQRIHLHFTDRLYQKLSYFYIEWYLFRMHINLRFVQKIGINVSPQQNCRQLQAS